MAEISVHNGRDSDTYDINVDECPPDSIVRDAIRILHSFIYSCRGFNLVTSSVSNTSSLNSINILIIHLLFNPVILRSVEISV